ncbi:hypothetical protein ACFPN7_36035 [Amycolatopsis halotolerans]
MFPSWREVSWGKGRLARGSARQAKADSKPEHRPRPVEELRKFVPRQAQN